MAHIALFHSILGRRSVEHLAVERWRRAGHEAVAVDLFDGATAAGIDDGFALIDRIGWDTVVDNGRRGLADMPDETVLAGLSMGTGVVCELLPERPGTAGILLLHAFPELPAGVTTGLRAQVHVAEPDEFARSGQLPSLRQAAEDADMAMEIFRYQGAGHFYIDRDLPDYDPEATELTWRRMLTFLDGS
ncbi:dienelactone hydrolase family protein [Stackebrandtia endophytica]|nr:dienelactone hydrolase family protein [Stackebrandtia endophytica]